MRATVVGARRGWNVCSAVRGRELHFAESLMERSLVTNY